MLHTSRRGLNMKLALLGATMLAGLSPALAQAQSQTQAPAAPAKDDSTVVVVTGYRASLTSATKAKKDSTNFTETIFAEDLGKFPDLNLAESMQRVPGMIVQRDALTGDGTQISVRALPAAFTLVTMDGNRVAVASDFGFTGSSQPNRQVDLDMFPTELFNRIDVNKTPSPDTMEGGVAGTVNIQNARPFDHKGPHLVLSVQDSYNMNARASSPRATFVASNTWDKFGALVGVTTTQKKIFSDGFETVGWGDPNLANFCTGCDPAATFTGPNGTLTPGANPGGSNQFKFSNTVYPYTGNGLTTGTTLNEAQLLALNPGLTETQIKSAVLPRLGRNYLLDGTSKNTVGLIALEYRASDTLKFNVDILGGEAQRNALRADMMWAVRSTGPGDNYNGGMIPLNMTVDSNNVVTGGTFANSAFLDENNEYHDKTGMVSVDAGFQWKPTTALTWNTELATMHSTYERDVTFMKFLSPFQTNITVNYADKMGNDIPTINTNINLNDPNLGWRPFQFLLQRDRRSVTSKSLHSDLSWDLDDNLTLKTGYDYDSYSRTINIHDNSQAFANAWAADIGGAANSGQYLQAMNVSHYMSGVSGTGYTNFIVPNFSKIQQAIGYSTLLAAPGSLTTGNTYNGAGASDISEKVDDAYLMAIDRTMIGNIPVKSNFGFRFQNTDQVVTSPSNLNGQIITIRTEHRYHDVLPSFNAVANVTENLNLRFAASKTMTRANPSQMSSQLGYGDPGGQNASEGNPNLKPYYSNNLDIGGEYYTSKTGYVGLTLFAKDIKNFTFNKAVVEPFTALGIPFSSITAQQQKAIATQLGDADPSQVTPAQLDGFNVNVTQPVNAAEHLKLTGQEFMWVQPLDFALKGLGYTFNYTHFHVSDIYLQAGVPDYTYNFTAFYERGGFSTHISYVDVGKMTIGTMPSPNSIPYNWFGAQRHQIDLSASYKFKAYGLNQSITLDGINLDRQGYYSYLGFKNVRYSYNNPGATILLGWRAQY